MIRPDQLKRALATCWGAIAAMLGADRARVEYELLPLLRALDLAQGVAAAPVIEAILALLAPYPKAHARLLQALRDAAPQRVKGASGTGLPAGALNIERYTLFPVFFGTDRARADEGAVVGFSGERGPPSVGVAEVSIPDDPRMGRVDRPRWWKLEFREDPQKHLMVHSISALAETDFVARARSTLEGTNRKQVLVFVHGYKVGFRDALVTAAQLAYDLHFEGLAALYSWPSEGSLPRYTVDEANVGRSRAHFTAFIELLRQRLDADAVHIVAHSMGNRMLIDMLAGLQVPAQTAPTSSAARLNQIVFAAPDVDAETFKDAAAKLLGKAERFTLYASSEDLALKASKLVHKYPRAGDSGLDLVITEPVDTVDVSAVDTSLLGHSYYAENRSVLTDLFYVIREGRPPQERAALRAKERYGARYWEFRR
ncbi:MAG: alpha/beta hydrolase [Burkholderiaceae bacterium]|jgi:esterase/lipase superfamily enzyme|nr:alpha/beta hydrolase [Burkholderiaceae bacterium]